MGEATYSCSYEAVADSDNRHVGTYDINISGFESDNYDITFVKGTLTVVKKALTIAADNKQTTYGQVAPAFTHTDTGYAYSENISSLTGEIAYACSYEAVAGSDNRHAGTYDINVSGCTSDDYDITYVKGSLTVNQKDLVVKADDKTTVYGLVAPSFTDTGTGFEYSETLANLTGEAAYSCSYEAVAGSANRHVGTYDINISGYTSADYNIRFEAGTLTVTKKDLVFTVDDKVTTYGQAAPEFTYVEGEYAYGEDVSYLTGGAILSCSYEALSTSDNRHAGDYLITMSGYTSDDYALVYLSGNLTVNKKDLVVSVSSETGLYGTIIGPDYFTYSYSGFEYGEYTEVLGGSLELVTEYDPAVYAKRSVGNYDVNVTGYTSNDYAISYVKGVLTINPKPFSIVIDDQNITYGEDAPTYTVTLDEFAFGEDESYFSGSQVLYCSYEALATSANRHAGDYDIVTTSVYTSTNYDITYANAKGILTVAKKDLTIQADDKTTVYGQAAPAFSHTDTGYAYSESISSLTGEIAYACSYEALATSTNRHAGTYDINVSGLTSDDYEIEFIKGTLTVQKIDIDITANDHQITYGDGYSNNGYVVDGSAFVYDDSEESFDGTIGYTYTYDVDTAHNVGTYDISVSGYTSRDYNINYIDGTLTVVKKDIVVMPMPLNTVYGEARPTYHAISEGFAFDDDESDLGGEAVFSCSYEIGNNIGDYEISVSGYESDNYNISYDINYLTVSKRPIKLYSEGAEPKVYDGLVLSNPNITICDDTEYDLLDGHKLVITGYPSIINSSRQANKMNLAVLSTDEATDYTSNYDLESLYEFDDLVIETRHIKVISGTAEKDYDGTPLTDHSYTIVLLDNNGEVIEGDAIVAKDYEIVNITGTIVNPLFDGDEVIGVPNTIASIVIKDRDTDSVVTQNYNIEYERGTLTINPRGIVIQTGSTSPKFYDDEYISCEEASIVTGSLPEGYRIEYSDFPRVKDAGTYKNTPTVTIYDELDNIVSSDDINVIINAGTIVIKPIVITIKTASASKDYDGTPLHASDYGLEPEITGEVLPIHLLEVIVTGEATNTGRYYNTVSIQLTDLDGNEIRREDNSSAYNIYYVNRSAFTMTPNNYVIYIDEGELLVKGNYVNIYYRPDRSWKVYDGEPFNCEHFDYDLYNYVDAELVGFDQEVSARIILHDGIEFASSVGKHTLLKDDYDVVIVDSLGNILDQYGVVYGDFSYRIYDEYEITIDGWNIYYNYDSLEHENDNTKFEWYGYLASGHSIEVNYSGSLTELGSIETPFTYAIYDNLHNDVTDLYTVDTIDGTLTIGQRYIQLRFDTIEHTYDGLYVGPDASYLSYADGLLDGHHVKNIVFEDKSFKDCLYDESGNLRSYVVYVNSFTIEDVYGNDVSGYYYSNDRSYINIMINPREVRFSSDDSSKEFDGTPLYGDASQVHYVSGLLDGDYYEIDEMTGSQTNVGSSNNSFEVSVYDENGNLDLGNYRIVKEYGDLTVEPCDIVIQTGSTTPKTYDNEYVSCEEASIISGSLPEGYRVEYSNFPRVKDAGTYYNIPTVTIYDELDNVVDLDDFDVRFEAGLIVINPIYINIYTESASKQYDGTPLHASDYGLEPEISGEVLPIHLLEAIVTGEAINIGISDNEASIRITDLYGNDIRREDNNELAYNIYYVDGSYNTESNNYIIYVHAGDLLITKRRINMYFDTIEHIYDGMYVGPDASYLTSVDGLLDGHELKEIVFEDKSFKDCLYDESGDLSSYVVGVTSFTVEDEYGNDVSEYYINADHIIIRIIPRDITFRSDDASIPYDGTTTLYGEVSQVHYVDGLLDGDYYELDEMTGSQTNIGRSNNSFEVSIYDENGNLNSGNYNVIKETGKLIVYGSVNVSLEDYEKVYDGLAANVVASCTYNLMPGYMAIIITNSMQNDVINVKRNLNNEVVPYLDYVTKVIITNNDTNEYSYVITYQYAVDEDGNYYVSSTEEYSLLDETLHLFKQYDEDGKLVDRHIKLYNDNGELEEILNAEMDDFAYEIATDFANITILPRRVALYSNNSVFTYDGYEHSNKNLFASVDLENDLYDLLPGHNAVINEQSLIKVRFVMFDEEGNIKSIKNLANLEDIRIVNGMIPFTSNYEIVSYSPGDLKVVPRDLTITTNDYEKEFDGIAYFESDDENLYIVEGLAETDTVIAEFYGNDEVGVGEHDMLVLCDIYNLETGEECIDCYNITYNYGVLSITGDEYDLGSGGFGGGFGPIEGSGDFQPIQIDPDFNIVTSFDGTVYLRGRSYGDYINREFINKGVPVYKDDINPLDYQGINNDGTDTITIDSTNGYYHSFLTSYYSNNGLSLYNDVYVGKSYLEPYTIYVYRGDATPLSEELLVKELVYRSFVYDNYLGLDLNSDLYDYLQTIIDEEGFTKDDPDIINKVSEYVKNSGRYNMFYLTDWSYDPVYYFLSTSHEGTDQLFAASAVLIYRMLGIPARYVTGYKVNAKMNEVTDVYYFDGVAWAEVYVDGYGWMMTDPTPAGGGTGGGNGTGGSIGGIGGMGDHMGEGIVIVPGEGGDSDTFYPQDGDLSTSMNYGDGQPGPAKPLFTVISTTSGMIHLKEESKGNYNGHGFDDIKYPYLSQYYNPMEYPSLALDDVSKETVTIDMTQGVKIDSLYRVAPYFIGESMTDFNDLFIYGDNTSPYSYDYTPEAIDYINYPTLDSEYSSYEEAYREYVYANYLSQDGMSDELKAFFDNVISVYGLSKDDPEIITKVASYIKSAAVYNLEFDIPTDCPDMVYYFLAVSKEGVCQHYAAAATMLFRYLGIPARWTKGFLVNATAYQEVVVTVRDYHAWTEVYIDGFGWVPVEVTGSNGSLGGISGIGDHAGEGVVEGEGSGSGEGGDSDKFYPQDGNLSTSVNYGDGQPGSAKPLFTVISTTNGMLHLKEESKGHYNGHGFDDIKYPYLNQYYNPMEYASLALKDVQKEIVTIDMTQGIEKDPLYRVAPYFIGESMTEFNDLYIYGDNSSPYSYYYTPEVIDYINYPTLGSEYSSYEEEYREYVYANYLSQDGMSDELKAFFDNVISVYGLSKDDPEIITKVASYIKSAAVYNLEFDIPTDCPDMVYYFLAVSKEGVCQHYAAAATMLFRYLGIPARWTKGFLVNATAYQEVVVTVRDYHAWTEVYIDGFGWVPVEVTGSANDNPFKIEVAYLEQSKIYDGNTFEFDDSLYKYIYRVGNAVTELPEGYSVVCVLNDDYQFERNVGSYPITPSDYEAYVLDSEGNVDERYTSYIEKCQSQYLILEDNEIIIAPSNVEVTYDGKNHTLSEYYVMGNLKEGHSVTIIPRTNVKEVGTFKANYTYYISDSNNEDVTNQYKVTKRDATITILPRPIKIYFTDIHHEYDGRSVTLTMDQVFNTEGLLANHTLESVGSNNSFSEKIYDESGELTYGVAYVDRFKVVDDKGNDVTKYYEIVTNEYLEYNRCNIYIDITSITVKPAVVNGYYDGTIHQATKAEVSHGALPLGYTIEANYTGSRVEPGESESSIIEGSVIIRDALGNDVTKDYDISLETGLINVIKRSVKVSAEYTGTYDGGTHQATIKWLEGELDPEEFDITCDIDGSRANAGRSIATISNLRIFDVDGNEMTEYFDIEYVDGVVDIAPYEVTIKPKDRSKPYDGTPLTSNIIQYETEMLEGFFIEIVTDGSATNSGDYPNNIIDYTVYDAFYQDVTDNFDVTTLEGVLSISRYQLTLTPRNQSFSYDGTMKYARSSLIVELEEDIDIKVTADVSGSRINVGTTDIIINSSSIVIKDSLGNDITEQFEITCNTGTLTVKKRAITIKPVDVIGGYNGDAYEASDYQITSSKRLVSGHTAYVTYGGSQTEIGTSDSSISSITILDANMEDVTDNYDITREKGKITVE